MSEARRRELAQFLRSRRERLKPADVGLPTGVRRRASGLRREEVAVLSGVSPAWYTFLEQGRDINPSAEVLDSLANVLGLSEDERRYMRTLANVTDPKPLPLASELPAEEIVRKLVRTADNSAYPVYGVDLYCDVVAWNPATAAYYTDFERIPAKRRNMLRWLLGSPEAKERLPDWYEETHSIVARWRAATATYNDGRLDKLVAEFRELSPEFDHWWDAYDVQEHRSRPRTFDHPEFGVVHLRLVIVQAPDFAPCVVVFHVPA